MKELPTNTLANGAEGIKDLITNFDDTYDETPIYITDIHLLFSVGANQIKSDIENERLPSAILFAALSSMAKIPTLYAHRPLILRHQKATM